jgi:hypothetical protein
MTREILKTVAKMRGTDGSTSLRRVKERQTMSKVTGNKYFKTSFRNSGRIAGMGMDYDDYSEESGKSHKYRSFMVRLPHDNVKPESLNGPVICYKKGEKNG